MADRKVLQFDYEDVHGRTVSGVVGRRSGPARWDTGAFVIEIVPSCFGSISTTMKSSSPWKMPPICKRLD
jgi:hypothetical protein